MKIETPLVDGPAGSAGSHPWGTENELELWAAAKTSQDPHALEQLVNQYLPLVRRIAISIYRSSGYGYVEFRDLVQIGTVGLLQSIKKFDFQRGIPFSAYAEKRIRGAILNDLPDESEYHAQNAYRMRNKKERAESLKTFSKSETKTDAFHQMVDIAVGLAVGLMLEGTSMFVAPEQTAQDPHDTGEVSAISTALKALTIKLSESERKVLEYHYGAGMSFSDIAQLLSVTRGRVSQLHAKAIAALRAQHKKKDLSLLL